MRPMLLILMVLTLVQPARAELPFAPACQRPEMQVHVWLIAASRVPGCIVYRRSWQELREHRTSARAGQVRIWPISGNAATNGTRRVGPWSRAVLRSWRHSIGS